MRERIDPYRWTVALRDGVQFVLFLRSLRRRIRDEKGTEAPPEPAIGWVNLNSLHGDGEGGSAAPKLVRRIQRIGSCLRRRHNHAVTAHSSHLRRDVEVRSPRDAP